MPTWLAVDVMEFESKKLNKKLTKFTAAMIHKDKAPCVTLAWAIHYVYSYNPHLKLQVLWMGLCWLTMGTFLFVLFASTPIGWIDHMTNLLPEKYNQIIFQFCLKITHEKWIMTNRYDKNLDYTYSPIPQIYFETHWSAVYVFILRSTHICLKWRMLCSQWS